jgi:hypothetical protein
MYKAGSTSSARLSDFLLFFFFAFFLSEGCVPWGELSRLEAAEAWFLSAVTCAGVPVWPLGAIWPLGGRLTVASGEIWAG